MGVVMFVKLMGEEKEALAGTNTSVYTDLPIAQANYATYAIKKKAI